MSEDSEQEMPKLNVSSPTSAMTVAIAIPRGAGKLPAFTSGYPISVLDADRAVIENPVADGRGYSSICSLTRDSWVIPSLVFFLHNSVTTTPRQAASFIASKRFCLLFWVVVEDSVASKATCEPVLPSLVNLQVPHKNLNISKKIAIEGKVR